MASLSVRVVTVRDNAQAQCALHPEHRSPPRADTVISMLRSQSVDDDYFHRRALWRTCVQRSPLDDFLPQASEIVPGLFVSDLYTATSPAVLAQLGITHVVSVLRKPAHRYPPPIQHLCVPIDDREDEHLLDFLDCAVQWVRTALERQTDARVLVHCVWGMSRSASVAAAYLVAARGMSLDQALRILRARRRVARPNAGFLAQLRVFERVTRLREEQDERRTREQATAGSFQADLDLDMLARLLGVCMAA